MARNGKSNGRNGDADTRLLKKVSLSLIGDIRETRRRITQNEVRIAQNEQLLAAWKQEHRAEMGEFKKGMTEFRKMSNIHSKAIIELLKKKSD